MLAANRNALTACPTERRIDRDISRERASGLLINGRSVAVLATCACRAPMLTAQEVAAGGCIDCRPGLFGTATSKAVTP